MILLPIYLLAVFSFDFDERYDPSTSCVQKLTWLEEPKYCCCFLLLLLLLLPTAAAAAAAMLLVPLLGRLTPSGG